MMRCDKKKFTKLDGDYAFPSLYCDSCVHFKLWGDPSTCDIFPSGIPVAIWRCESEKGCPCDKFIEDDAIIEYDEDLPEIIEDL